MKEESLSGITNQNKQKTKISGNHVIVIGRQFGSGGRRIGRIIATKLGLTYYDTELLSQAAESLGFHPDIFKKHDEKKPSTLRTIVQGAYGIADNFHPVSLGGEKIYGEQRRIIKEICKDKGCVIVGRTADYILRNREELFSVFLHSPLEHRASRIFKRGEANSIDEAIETARKKDRDRESFYNYFTGSNKWGLASNYHLSIDTSGLEDEDVAEIIIKALEARHYNKQVNKPSIKGNNDRRQKDI